MICCFRLIFSFLNCNVNFVVVVVVILILLIIIDTYGISRADPNRKSDSCAEPEVGLMRACSTIVAR